MSTKCALLALACSLGLSAAAVAETVADLVTEEVYVTGAVHAKQPWQNAAGAADVVETQRQLPSLGFDVADIFKGLPGVQADSRSNFAQDTRLTLRGFGARSAFGVRGIDIRLDTIPLTMPD
ncbi:MAG TPA: iron transporter, partial [Cellvibrionaceae bacterium]